MSKLVFASLVVEENVTFVRMDRSEEILGVHLLPLESELDVIIDNHNFSRDINDVVLRNGGHEDEGLGIFLANWKRQGVLIFGMQ